MDYSASASNAFHNHELFITLNQFALFVEIHTRISIKSALYSYDQINDNQ